MSTPKATGLQRLLKATGYSWQGLKAAFVHEAAFRQELVFAILLIPLGLYLGNNGSERAILVAVIILVLIVELLNSCAEAIVDKIGTDHHVLSGRAKDIASAAVLLALLNAAIVWGLVLLG